MNATSTHTKPAGRVRIVIVDPELRLGLRLADCLATSGYQAVLVRDRLHTHGAWRNPTGAHSIEPGFIR